MAETLAIWVSNPALKRDLHSLLARPPFGRSGYVLSVQSLRNRSRWLRTQDQTVSFAGKCPIVRFSNARPPGALFYTHMHGREMAVIRLLSARKTQKQMNQKTINSFTVPTWAQQSCSLLAR